MKTITVLLVEDHTIVREGLRHLLDLEDGIKVIGEGADGMQAIALAEELKPAIIVMDLAMPRLNGLEAARRILQAPSPPKVIILSAHGDDAYVEQVVAMGVSGYLVKQSSAHILGEAIRTVASGKNYYSPIITKRMNTLSLDTPARANRHRPPTVHLTSREREVLQLIVEGHANKVVASELDISIKTVEKHRQSVMRKLNIHDVAGLTRYAIAAGIIESSVQCTII